MAKNWGFNYNIRRENKKVKDVLCQLAEKFAGVHREYLRFSENEETRWSYAERPNIGFLAAAAWRIPGWIALEEYATTKKREAGQGKGRADLYIGARTKNDTCELGIECKIISPGRAKGVQAALNAENPHSMLGRAMSDARAISKTIL